MTATKFLNFNKNNKNDNSDYKQKIPTVNCTLHCLTIL